MQKSVLSTMRNISRIVTKPAAMTRHHRTVMLALMMALVGVVMIGFVSVRALIHTNSTAAQTPTQEIKAEGKTVTTHSTNESSSQTNASGNAQGSTNTQAWINGQQVPVPENGTTSRTITNENGTTQVTITNNTSSDGSSTSSSMSSSSVGINSNTFSQDIQINSSTP